jgi:uncharacterized membrane protein YkvA (DUF1232 family)
MPGLDWVVPATGVVLVAYLALVVGLIASGRPSDARALAGFIPDCLALLRRLMRDARVPRRHKLLLGAAFGYLVMPLDLVPEFIPVVGYLDDALVVALALRCVLNGAGPHVVAEHWRGPERSLSVLLRLSRPGIALGSPWARMNRSAVAVAVGALGLGLCVWFDIADNCTGGITCREKDPMLLSTGWGMATALCVAGALALATQASSRWWSRRR